MGFQQSLRSLRTRGRIRTSAVALFLSGAVAASAWAAPTGVNVVAGTVSVTQTGAVTQITASHNSIIQYSGFNIAGNETVQFIQPAATSRVLNRITSGTPTQIDGTLLANGQVYLVNPAGIMFGATSVINTGGLFAAAANLTDADFLSGNLHFSGTGLVSNLGSIQSPLVALVGQTVSNHGSIITPDQGTVIMAAGDDIFITPVAGGLSVLVTANTTPPAGDSLDHSGSISAPKGKVFLGVGDMYSLATHTGSTIQAKEVTVQGGPGSAVDLEGSIDASDSSSGGVGGQVTILGGSVTLNGASVDVSGDAGGGTINIGGSLHGAGPLPNADFVGISEDSTLRADALNNGNGGSIILFSEGRLVVVSTTSALGGPQGGDGGFLETSGKISVVTEDMIPTLRGPKGKGGTWFFDPPDLVIGSDDAVPGQEDDDPASPTFHQYVIRGTTVTIDEDENTEGGSASPAPGTVSFLHDFQIEGQLGNGVNFVAATTNTFQLSPLTIPAGGGAATLEYNSTKTILIETGAVITSAVPLDINLHGITDPAGQVLLHDAISTGGGAVSIGSAATPNTGSLSTSFIGANTINTSGGAVQVFQTGPVIVQSSAARGTFTAINAGGGAITVSSTTGNVQFDGNLTGQNAAVSASTGLVLHDVTTTGQQTFSTTTGIISLNSTYTASNSGISVTGAVSLDSASGTVALNATNGNIIQSGGNITGNNKTLNVTATSADVNIAGNINGVGAFTTTATNVTLANVTSTGAQSVAGSGAVSMQNVSSGAALSSISGNTVTTNNINAGTATVISVTSANLNNVTTTGDTTVTSAGSAALGTVVVSAGNATVTGTGNVTLHDVTTSGAQTFTTTAGVVSLNSAYQATTGNINITGNVSLDSASGAVSLTSTNGSVQFFTGNVTGNNKALSLSAGSRVDMEGDINNVGTLVAQSPTVILHDVSSSSSQTVTGTNISLNSTYTAASGNIAAAGNVSLDTLAAGVTITAQNGSVLLSSGDVTGNDKQFTLQATGGNVSVTGNINAVNSLNASGINVTLHDVTSNAAQTITASNVSLNSTYTAGSGDISVTGNVSLDTVAAAVTLQAQNGSILFNSGNVTGNNKSLAITAGGGGNILLSGSVNNVNTLAAQGNAITLHDVTSAGNQTITGSTVSLNSTYQATNGNINVTGNVSLDSASGAVTLSSTTGSVQFSGGNVAGNGKAFTLTSGNQVSLEGDINGVGTLAAQAEVQIVLHNVSSTGAQTITAGQVSLNSTYTAGNGNIAITGLVSLDSQSGQVNVAAQNGSILLLGGVNGNNRSLSLHATGGDVRSDGDIGADKLGLHTLVPSPVDEFTAIGHSIDLHNVTSDGDQTMLADINGTIALHSTYNSHGANIFINNGLLGVVASDTPGINVPTVATIFKSETDANLTFLTEGGNFTMGHGQKLSVNGDLTIDTRGVFNGDTTPPDGNARLGDITVGGNLRVDTGTGAITLDFRNPGFTKIVASTNQTFYPTLDGSTDLVTDGELHFIAGGSITFVTSRIINDPHSPRPKFAAGDTTDSNLGGNTSADTQYVVGKLPFAPVLVATNGSVTDENGQTFTITAGLTDLSADFTIPPTNEPTDTSETADVVASADTVASVADYHDRPEELAAIENPGGIAGDALSEVIRVRPMTGAEFLQSVLQGFVTYQDTSSVALARLDPAALAAFNSQFTAFFATAATNVDGTPKMADGKPVMVSNAPDIQKSIQTAYTAYKASASTKSFHDYLVETPQGDALKNVDQLRHLIDLINALQLTPGETNAAINRLLALVAPAGVKPADFRAIIEA